MNSRRYWLIVSAISLVVALVTLVVIKAPRTVPLEQCSEVYQRYHDTPGIQASFIKNKRINDTLCLDMTIFKAEDSSSFVNLLSSWDQSDEMISGFMKMLTEENDRYVKVVRRGHPELGADTLNDENNDFIVVFPVKRSVAVLHTKNTQQIDVLLLQNWRKTFNIQ